MSDLKFIVTNQTTYIKGKMESEVYQGLRKLLGYTPEDAYFKMQYNKHWDGIESTLHWNRRSCKCSIKKDGTHFPTGLLSMAKDFLYSKGLSISFEDQREKYLSNLDISIVDDYKLRDYQYDTIMASAERERGIIKMCTGAGKTFVGAGLIKEVAVSPFIFYVTSVDLLIQARNEIQKFLISNGKNLEVGVIGGGMCDIRDVNIMTVQTAVRSCGKKYIKFDEEDKSKEDFSDLEKNKKDIYDLIRSSKAFIADECITGDTLVYTKDGIKQIKELYNYRKEILSYSGNSVVWNKVLNFYDKGLQETLIIKLLSGDIIKCTKDHPIMTQEGWKEAGKITKKDQILSIASVGVVDQLMLKVDHQVNIPNSFLDIRSKKKNTRNGKSNLKKPKNQPLYVNVDVVRRLISKTVISNHLLGLEEQKNIALMFMDMTREILHGNCLLLKKKNKLFMEHYLEILVYLYLIQEAKTLDCNGIMEFAKKNGLFINVKILKGLIQNITLPQIGAMENIRFVVEPLVLQLLKKFTILFIRMVRKGFLENGLINWELWDYCGGYAMMDQKLVMALDCIQKVLRKRKLKLLKTGLMKDMERLPFIGQEDIIRYQLVSKPGKKLWKKLVTDTLAAWDINFIGIEEIKSNGLEKVYDIEVENAHNFFANNILVHNCHHWSSESAQVIADFSGNARYRWGMSGTPWRDKGDDILIDSCFGRLIKEVKASDLIERGFLVKPDIYFVPIKKSGKQLPNYQTIYKQCVVENEYRNNIIANITKAFAEKGRTILVLCQQVNHGKILEEMIEGSTFLSGATSQKKREEHLDKIRNHEAKITISTVIFDEGVDCKPLDALILCGSGKSQTRALQRVGRVIRTYENNAINYVKKDAVVVDFEDQEKYLLSHARKRKKIYQTEPLFDIKYLEI